MVSATPDAAAAANAAFQAAPSWLTRANTPPANDLFGNLVNRNTPSDTAAALPPPPPPQNNADAAPRPPDNNAAANNNAAPANNNTSNPPPAYADSSAAANNPPPSNANARNPGNADTGTSANGSTANGASQTTTTTTSGTTSAADRKSKDKPTDTDSTAADATILTLQAGSVTPVAVAVPTSTPATNVPTSAPTSGGPTAPLAIAAAALAASSQPLLPPPGPSGQVKTDPTPPTHDARHFYNKDRRFGYRIERERAGQHHDVNRHGRGDNGGGRHRARHAEDHTRKRPGRARHHR